MSKRRKRQFRFATFSILPVVLVLAVLVPVFLASSGPVGATSASDLTTVKTYVAAYIANQYAADAVSGESGFVIDRDTLRSRIDSNSDMNLSTGAGVLGEGDDAANAPVIIDNLTQTYVIPGTAIQCKWNTFADTTNCFNATNVTAVKAKVDAHAAAGFSTDIVDYCLSGHTEAPTTGGWGYIAQAPNGLGTGMGVGQGSGGTNNAPHVLAFKWGRNGWVGTAHAAYGNANPLAAPAAAGSYTPPTTVPAASACDSSVSDAELMRCQAQWAIYNGTVNGMTGGNVGNGISPTGVSPLQTLAGSQFVDIRTGNPDSISISGKETINNPINDVFTDAGLAKLNSGLTGGTAGIIVAGRTQMTGGIVAMGLKMLGEPVGTNGFLNSGMPNWNNTLDEKQNTSALSPAYPIPGPTTTPAGDLHAVVDTVIPIISGIGNGTPDTTTVNITWTTNEPATSRVLLGTAPGGPYTQVNTGCDSGDIAETCTILRASHSLTLTGLSAGTPYYYTVVSYDGAANVSDPSSENSFTTAAPTDITAPVITSILPSGNIIGDSADVSVYYNDGTGSGINIASVTVTLNGSDITSACTITAGYASCPRTGLAQGANGIGISVSDNATNTTTDNSGSFFVDTRVPKAVDIQPQNVAGGGWGSTSAAITAHVIDVAPMWPVDANSGVDPDTIAVTLDGDPVAGCSNTPSTYESDETLPPGTVPSYDLSCSEVTGLSQGNHTVIVTEQDMFGNAGSNTRTFNVDTIAPDVTGLAPSGIVTSGSTTLSGSYSDTGTGISLATATASAVVTLNLSPVSGCTILATSVSCDVTGLANGDYSFTVTVNDNTGNNGTASGSFTVATLEPSVDSIVPSGNLTTNEANVSVYYTDNSGTGINTGTVSMRLNSEDITSACTVTADYASCPRTGLPQGANTVGVTVSDNMGATTTDNSGAFFVDTKVPKAVDIQPQNVAGGGWGSTSAAITAYVIDVAPMWPVDANSGVDPDTIAVTLDGDPVAGCSNTPSTYESDETLPPGTVPSYDLSCPEVTGLSQGNHTVIVTEQDMFGNAGSNTRTFNVDTIAPDVTGLAPSGTTSSGSTTLSASYSDAGTGISLTTATATATVTLDGSPVSGCSILATGISCPVSGLANGLHSYSVSVNDNTGNAGSNTGSFRVATAAPSITSILPTGNINTIDADVSVYYTDNSGSGIAAASVYVNLNGEDITAGCTVTDSFTSCPRTGLPQGDSTISAGVSDNLSHAATGSGEFFADTMAPKAVDIQPQNVAGGGYGSTSATITASIIDVAPTWPVEVNSGINPGTIAVTLDGDPVGGCTWLASTHESDETLPPGTVPSYDLSCPAVSGLAQGSHTAIVTEQDMIGNSGSNTRTFNIDTNAPSITNLAPTGTLNSTDVTLSADFTDESGTGINTATAAVILDGAPVTGCTISPTNASCAVYGLKQGAHGFTVSVSDNTGNASSAAGSFTTAASSSFWTMYDNIGGDNWVLLANPASNASSANIELQIGGSPMNFSGFGGGIVAPGEIITPTFNIPASGPVKATSTNGVSIIMSQRILWPKGGNSLEEVPGTEESKLSDHFWWTWYDQQSAGFANWVLIANPSATDTVHTVISFTNLADGLPVTSESDIVPGGEWNPTFPGKMGGPIEVKTYLASGSWPNDARNVIASQRVLSNGGSAFNEMPGIPDSELSDHYLWTWYDQKGSGFADWVLVANPSATETVHAVVSFTNQVDGLPITAENDIAAGEEWTPNFPGKQGGPVEVKAYLASGSWPNDARNVIASQRIIAGPSFGETRGYAYSTLASDYHWTWYDQLSAGVTNWVLVANPSGDTVHAVISFTNQADGTPVTAESDIAPYASWTPTFAGKMGGPVKVTSTGGSVMVSQRVMWKGYFNEVLGTVLN